MFLCENCYPYPVLTEKHMMTYNTSNTLLYGIQLPQAPATSLCDALKDIVPNRNSMYSTKLHSHAPLEKMHAATYALSGWGISQFYYISFDTDSTKTSAASRHTTQYSAFSGNISNTGLVFNSTINIIILLSAIIISN